MCQNSRTKETVFGRQLSHKQVVFSFEEKSFFFSSRKEDIGGVLCFRKEEALLVLCFVTISGWCVFSCWTNKKQRGKHENSRKKRKAVLNKKEMLTHSLAPRTPRTPRSVSSSLKRTVARRTTPVFQRKGASSETHRLSKKNKKNYSSNKKNRCSSNNRAVLGVLREARRTTPVFQRKESFF